MATCRYGPYSFSEEREPEVISCEEEPDCEEQDDADFETMMSR